MTTRWKVRMKRNAAHTFDLIVDYGAVKVPVPAEDMANLTIWSQ